MPIPLALVLGGVAVAIAFAVSDKAKPQSPPGQPGAPPYTPPLPPGTIPPGTIPGVPGTGQGQPGQPGAPKIPPIPQDVGNILGGLLGGGFPGMPGTPGGGTTPTAATGGEWWMVSPTDSRILQARPEKQPELIMMLGQKTLVPCTAADMPCPPNAFRLSDTPPTSPDKSALVWLTNETNTKGKHVIMALSRPIVAAIPVGDEVGWCNANVKQFALIAEALSTLQPQPGTTQPGQSTPGQKPGATVPTIFVPGLGEVPVPQAPGAPAPGAPPAPGGAPGGIAIPGFGTIPMPGLPGSTSGSSPGVMAGPSQERGPSRAGDWPVSHIHVVRQGVNPIDVALHYTGQTQRAHEIRTLNKLQGLDKNMKPTNVKGDMVYFSPWYGGDRMALPLDWNMSKGEPQPKYGTPLAAKNPNNNTTTTVYAVKP